MIAGATLLKGIRLERGVDRRRTRAPFAAGAAASFASTLGSTGLISQVRARPAR